MRKKALVGPLATLSSGASGGLEQGVLVVMELGSDWPASLVSSTAARRVLTQAEGEAPSAFAERVASSLDGLFDRGIQLETFVLACNERLDETADAARRKALGLALGRMAMAKQSSRSRRVYLAAALHSSGRLRHALSSLAQGLYDEWGSAGLEVSVDFPDAGRAETEAKPFAFTARVA